MVYSMTGFGRGEAPMGGGPVRRGDPRGQPPLSGFDVEDAAPPRLLRGGREVGRARAAQRGKIDVTILVQSTAEEDVAVSLNAAAARQYRAALSELARETGLADAVDLALLAQLPDVLRQGRPEFDEAAVAQVVTDAARAALDAFEGMRAQEGAALAEDFSARLDELDAVAAAVAEAARRSGVARI